MSDTTFVARTTTILAAWLNQINKFAFWGRSPNYATTTGAANAQILTLAAGSLYSNSNEADGDEFWFKAGFTNTGAMTLQIIPPSGTNTAVAVQLNGQALVGGEVQVGLLYKVSRLGTTWQLHGPTQLTDGLPLIVNAADITKKLKLALSGFTTANTRTWTVQDANDTFVGRDTTDTLTNKTLTNPANTSQALSYQVAGTTAWDTSLGAVAAVTAGAGNTTMGAPTNLKAGGFYTLIFTQDGTGGRTVTWNAVFKGAGGAAMTQPQATASATTEFNFVSDGTNLYLVGNADGAYRSVQIYTSTGANTWTKPAGLRRVRVTVVAGGGSGGGANTSSGYRGTGGGGGGASIKTISAASLGTTETATVGPGGAAVAGSGTPTAGNAGGTSSFGSHCTATGGSAGSAGVSGAIAGSAGGAGASGDINLNGGPSLLKTGAGLDTSFGGEAGDAALGFGFHGVNIAAASVGYGAGGNAGNHSGGNSAAGRDGIIIVEEFF